MMRSLSIRAKLTSCYLLVSATALLLFGILSYSALQYTLLKGKQANLEHREQRLLLFLAQRRNEHAEEPLSEDLQSYAVIAHEGNLLQIRTLQGSVIFPTEMQSAWLADPQTKCDAPAFRDVNLEGHPTTVMCHVVGIGDRQVRLYIGGSLDDDLYILGTYKTALLLLLPGLLCLAAIGGYFMSRHAMSTVDQMTKAALSMGIGNLSLRLPVPPARDELQSLAIAWNQLLDRLEGAVSRLSRFSADASHDLRTSITVILGTAQLSLHRHRSEQEYRDDLDRIVTECRTASTLLDALLSLARSHNFVHEVTFRPVDTTELVLTGCRRVEDLAESSGIVLDWRLPEDPTLVEGDEVLLQRLLGILLDNALKYTPEHGEIMVELCRSGAEVFLTVRDTGIGMSEDVRQRIFERFYQGDLREKKVNAGSGLGLSIARWIADAHRAKLTVESSPMKGSRFEICFPTAPVSGTDRGLRSDFAGTLS
jgi:two-component system heavy metal sensor histidine kinase CusS